MVLRVLNWGKEPIYYVQKSYRKAEQALKDYDSFMMLVICPV